MRFSAFWPCSGNAGFCAPHILAEGRIERDTGLKFSQFIKNKTAHRYQLPPRPTISFDSPGGSVAGGLDLGRLIRRYKFDTQLSSSYSQVVEASQLSEKEFISAAKCASACTLAFLGGISREVSETARFGIHQFSGGARSIGDGATQVTVVVLAAYIEEMGVNRALLDQASLVTETSIRWLSPQEVRTFKVDNTTPQINPWAIKASSQGIAMLHTEQDVSFGRRMSVTLAIDGGRTFVLAQTNLRRAVYKEDRTKQFPVNEAPELSFIVDGKTIPTQAVQPWSRVEKADGTSFRALAAISFEQLKLISRAKTLEISDNFGTATSDLSLSTSLSSEGLVTGVALLLRSR